MQKYRVFMAGVCSLLLTAGLARFAYTPLLPIMRDQAGLSYLASGWLASFNYMGYMTGALLVASISRLTVKFHLYHLGLIVAVFSTLGMGLTDHIVVWAILRYVSGLTTTCGMLIASGLIMNWLIRQRQAPLLGLHFAGLGLGIAVSGIAVGSMVGHLAWDVQWIVLGLLGVVFFIPAWLWMPAPADIYPDASHQIQLPPSRKWMNLLIASYFCAGFGYVISATFIVAILEKLPALAGRGSWVWVVVGLAAAPSSFLWDRIARRSGQIPALLLAYGLQVISVLIPVLSENISLNVISAILYGSTFVGIVSLTLSLIGRHFPNNPAKAMARLTLSYGVAQMIAPVMAGCIANATGSYHGVLVITAIVLIAGMGLLLALNRLEIDTPM
ncbi:putative MFS family arabinose efflux permease [Oxalobacteraceae bacterium GrIS 2.11]